MQHPLLANMKKPRKFKSLRDIYGGHFGPQGKKPEIKPGLEGGNPEERNGEGSEVPARTTEVKGCSREERSALESGITAVTTEVKGGSREEKNSVESGITAPAAKVSSGSKKGLSGSGLSKRKIASRTKPRVAPVGTKANGFSGDASMEKGSKCSADNQTNLLHPPKEREGGNGGSERENASCCLSSANSISEVEKAIDGTPLGNADANPERKLNISSKDSLKEVLCSKTSDISSLRDSCAGPSSLKEERSGCSGEQVQSSLAREITSRTSSSLCDEHTSAVSLQLDTGNNGEQSAEVAKCSNNVEPSNMLAKVVEEADTGKAIIESVPAACGQGSGISEFVCDICGDTGKEHLLTICGKCNDGAAHIYCMRVKLDKLPEGDWMCEECALSEETGQKHQEKSAKGSLALKKISSNEAKQNPQHPSASKGSGLGKIGAHSGSSPRSLFAKSPPGSGEASSVRKRSVGTITRPSSHGSKRLKHDLSGQSSETALKPPKPPVSKGPLSKSKSFPSPSSKQKVQLSEEGNKQMLNVARETAENDSKEGASRSMLKSLSFNDAALSGRNNTNDGRKTLPPKLRHAKRSPCATTEKIPTSAVNNPPPIEKDQNATAPEKASITEPPRSNHQDLPTKKRHIRSKNALEPVVDLGKSCLSTEKAIYGIAGDENVTAPEKTSITAPPRSIHQDLPTKKKYIRSNNALEPVADLGKSCLSTEKDKGSVDDVRHLVVSSAEDASVTITNDSNAVVRFEETSTLRDGAMSVSLKNISPQMKAIPEPYPSWQGRFEISIGDELSIVCDGLQAHLSCLASPEILDMVKKFPQKLEFAEVPRMSRWPAHFVVEKNIAFYIFARDLESYDKSYKSLVDNMMKKDICFTGNFSGFELLVFSSNLLPEKAQRWNSLFFLWGTFKGTKHKLPICKSTGSSCLKGERLGQDPPAPAISADSAPANQSNENSTSAIEIPTIASGKAAEVKETKASPTDQKLLEDVQTGQQGDLLGTPMIIESSGVMPTSIEIPTIASGTAAEVKEMEVSLPDQKLWEDMETGQQGDLLGALMKNESSGDKPTSSIEVPTIASGKAAEVKETEGSASDQKLLEDVQAVSGQQVGILGTPMKNDSSGDMPTSSIEIPTIAAGKADEVMETEVSPTDQKLLEDVETGQQGGLLGTPMKNESSGDMPTSSVEIPTLASGEIAEVKEIEVYPPDQKLLEDVQAVSAQQVDLLGSPLKNESSGDMPPADSSDERERGGIGSKRGLDIDLNCPLEENDEETSADAEHPSKRLKPSIGETEGSTSFTGVIGSTQIPSFPGSGNGENWFRSVLQQADHPGNEHHWLSSRFPDLNLSLSLPKQPEPETFLSLALPSRDNPGASSSSSIPPPEKPLPWWLK